MNDGRAEEAPLRASPPASVRRLPARAGMHGERSRVGGPARRMGAARWRAHRARAHRRVRRRGRRAVGSAGEIPFNVNASSSGDDAFAARRRVDAQRLQALIAHLNERLVCKCRHSYARSYLVVDPSHDELAAEVPVDELIGRTQGSSRLPLHRDLPRRPALRDAAAIPLTPKGALILTPHIARLAARRTRDVIATIAASYPVSLSFASQSIRAPGLPHAARRRPRTRDGSAVRGEAQAARRGREAAARPRPRCDRGSG